MMIVSCRCESERVDFYCFFVVFFFMKMIDFIAIDCIRICKFELQELKIGVIYWALKIIET